MQLTFQHTTCKNISFLPVSEDASDENQIASKGICLQPLVSGEFSFADLTDAILGLNLIFLYSHKH